MGFEMDMKAAGQVARGGSAAGVVVGVIGAGGLRGKIDWAGVVREYGSLVYGTAMRMLRNESDAADCFQSTFLAAYEASEREEVRSWPGLLRRIATSRALDIVRRRRRERDRFEDGVEVEHQPGRWCGPGEGLEVEELGGRLREAMAELPEQQAEVFWMRYIDQMSYEEIAVATGLSGTNVGVLLHRARKALAERLKEKGEEDGKAGGGSGRVKVNGRAVKTMGIEDEVPR